MLNIKGIAFLLGVLLLGGSGLMAKEVQAYSYGPACQWVRLIGTIEGYEDWDKTKPLLLTVTYQGPDQRAPATLLTGYPLYQRHFSFVLSGFNDQIEGVKFISPFLGFDEPVTFRYFVSSPNGVRLSELKTIEYRPERIKQGGEVRCHSKLALPALQLKR